jgi:Na+-driven multidrug efflux pump
MYPIILSIHSVFRWVVLLTALWAIIRFVSGWLGRKRFDSADASARKFYTISLDIQFLLGLILLFVSPLVTPFFADIGAGMKNPVLRKAVLEHTIMMLAAVTLAHIGAAMSKKPTDDTTKFRKGAIFFILSLVAILVGIPWDRGLGRFITE